MGISRWLAGVGSIIAGFSTELSLEEIEETLDLRVIARISNDERVMTCFSREVPFMISYPDIAPSMEVERLARLLARIGGEKEEKEKEAEEKAGS